MRARIATRSIGDLVINVYHEPNLGVAGKYSIESTIGEPDEIKITKIKTFDSETAWSDAERYANDLIIKSGLDYTYMISL